MVFFSFPILKFYTLVFDYCDVGNLQIDITGYGKYDNRNLSETENESRSLKHILHGRGSYIIARKLFTEQQISRVMTRQ